MSRKRREFLETARPGELCIPPQEFGFGQFLNLVNIETAEHVM